MTKQYHDIIIDMDKEYSNKQLDSILEYVQKNKKNTEGKVDKILLKNKDNHIDIDILYIQDKPKIERIRRITGYLTGDLNTWNQAKLSELKDRCCHL